MSRVEFSLSMSGRRRRLLSNWIAHVAAQSADSDMFAGLPPTDVATIKTLLGDMREVMQTALPNDWFPRAQHYTRALSMAVKTHGAEGHEDKLFPYLAVLLYAAKVGGMDKVAEQWLSEDNADSDHMVRDAAELVREMGAFLRLVIVHKPHGDDAEIARIKGQVDTMLEDVEESDFADRLASQFQLLVH